MFHISDTAIWLVDQDSQLATYKDNNGKTALHLLASMETSFESTSRDFGFFEELIYRCKSFYLLALKHFALKFISSPSKCSLDSSRPSFNPVYWYCLFKAFRVKYVMGMRAISFRELCTTKIWSRVGQVKLPFNQATPKVIFGQ